MKKIIFLLVLCFVTTSLMGCQMGNGGKNEGPSLNQKAGVVVEEIGKIKVGEEHKVKYTLNLIEGEVTFASSNKKIAEVNEDGLVKGLKEGKTEITVKCVTNDKTYEDTIEVEVYEEKNEHECDGEYVYDETHHWKECSKCEGVREEHEFETEQKIENGIMYTTKTCYCSYKIVEEEKQEPVDDVQAPQFVKKDNYQEVYELNWGKEFDAFIDLDVVDNKDGNVNSKVEVISEINNKKYGEYKVSYKAKDNAGNESLFERTVKVTWNYDVQFIGHAGSYYGLMNSEEAIMYAIQVLQYQCVEVDIKQTSDGVFVLCHDDAFGDYTIASTSWSVLKDVEVTKSRTAGIPGENGSVTKDKYTAKLCTLDRFLEICKEYNVRPVLELKYSKGINSSDQSRMQALMDHVDKYNLTDQTILLSSQYQCLIWTREHGYSNVTCQYLVNSLESETYLKRCLDYDFEISINVTGNYTNSDDWIFKYQDAGVRISTYTFTQYVDYPTVQKWINLGVNYVTCDWQLMSKLNLEPEKVEKFKVTFVDYDGSIIQEGLVSKGGTPVAPYAPTRPGYNFIGWNKEFKNIQTDIVITAVYEEIPNSVLYIYEKGNLKEKYCTTVFEMIDLFWAEVYEWSDTTKNFETFKAEAMAAWKDGNEYADAKIYKGGQKNQVVEGYFVSCSANYDRWMPWMNEFDKQVTVINKAQSAWGSNYVGYLRLYSLLNQSSNIWTSYPEREEALYKLVGERDVLPSRYTVGVVIELPELIDPNGATFLGWFDKDGNKVTQVGDKELGTITLTARWSE